MNSVGTVLSSVSSVSEKLSERSEHQARVAIHITNRSNDLRLNNKEVCPLKKQCSIHRSVTEVHPNGDAGTVFLGPGTRKRDLGFLFQSTHFIWCFELCSDVVEGLENMDDTDFSNWESEAVLECEMKVLIPGKGLLRRGNHLRFTVKGCDVDECVLPDGKVKLIELDWQGTTYMVKISLPDIPTPTIDFSISTQPRSRRNSRSFLVQSSEH